MGSADGARKSQAVRIGVSLEELDRRLAAGERWCWGCKAFHTIGAFSKASPICKAARSRRRSDRK